MADLDDILSSGRESAPVSQEQPKEVEAPAQEPVEQEASAPTDDGSDNQAQVPVAALQAERQKAKTYREQVSDFQRQLEDLNRVWEQRLNQVVAAFAPQQQAHAPQPPEFWDAPETAIDYRLNQAVTPLQAKMQEIDEKYSRILAEKEYGKDAVDAAFRELATLRASNSPEFGAAYQQVMASQHSFGSLVEWHKERLVNQRVKTDPRIAEFAADPDGFLKKQLAELMQASPQPSPSPSPGVMPSNFATSRNVGSRSGPAWGGPQALGDIFKR